jgi:hypothetical protein
VLLWVMARTFVSVESQHDHRILPIDKASGVVWLEPESPANDVC